MKKGTGKWNKSEERRCPECCPYLVFYPCNECLYHDDLNQSEVSGDNMKFDGKRKRKINKTPIKRALKIILISFLVALVFYVFFCVSSVIRLERQVERLTIEFETLNRSLE